MEQMALDAFVGGPRKVQAILDAVDELTRSGADSGARRAMLDVLVELELLRGLVSGMANALPTCVRCGEHLAAYSDKELLDEQDTCRCHACFEDLPVDDRTDYKPLPWCALVEKLEGMVRMWREKQVPPPDPASVAQMALPFR